MSISYKEFVKALETVRAYQGQVAEHYKEVTEKLDSISVYATVSRETNIKNSKLSPRTLGTLSENGIVDLNNGKVSDLESRSLKEMGCCRGLGMKGMNEIKELCLYTGVSIKP